MGDATPPAAAAAGAAATVTPPKAKGVRFDASASKGDGGSGTPPPSLGARRGTPSPAALRAAAATAAAVAELEATAARHAARSVPARLLFAVGWAAWAAALVALIVRLRLVGLELAVGGAAGAAWGLAAAALYHVNRKWKAERCERLAMIPGAKGMQALVHHIPTWVSLDPTERLEWLNRLLAKAWPYYDAAVCAAVKDAVEPLLNAYKPPGLIKRIYFKKLTFGDDPFRVEGIRVDRSKRDCVQIEVDYRWAGDANIFLAIELPVGGAATRMVPKVSNIAVSGTARVVLAPLLPEIPGFGAATASLMRPPVVKFSLDFGKAFGGSLTAGAVSSWLDPFLRETVSSLLVWPRRLVVPLLDEALTGPLDDLYLRHKGALQVDVVQARGLPKMDTVGSADPVVEAAISERPDVEPEATSTKKNTQAPVWNERLWLLVQEPESQALLLTASDVDAVNLGGLLRANVLAGAANVVRAKEVIGRARVPVAPLAERPGQEVDAWHPLGAGGFADDGGPGRGRGELRLRCTYWPLEAMGGHADAPFGALVVTLLRCDNLVPADLPIFSSDPYVRFRVGSEKPQVSRVVWSALDPKWEEKPKFDWFKVPRGERLRLKVMDKDVMSGDELLGRAEVDVYEEVAKAPGGDVIKTLALCDVPPQWIGKRRPGDSTITLRLQWVPFHYTPDAQPPGAAEAARRSSGKKAAK